MARSKFTFPLVLSFENQETLSATIRDIDAERLHLDKVCAAWRTFHAHI